MPAKPLPDRVTEAQDPLVAKLKQEFPQIDESEIERVCERGRGLLRPHVRHTLADAVEWYARARLSLLREHESVEEIVTLMRALVVRSADEAVPDGQPSSAVGDNERPGTGGALVP